MSNKISHVDCDCIRKNRCLKTKAVFFVAEAGAGSGSASHGTALAATIFTIVCRTSASDTYKVMLQLLPHLSYGADDCEQPAQTVLNLDELDVGTCHVCSALRASLHACKTINKVLDIFNDKMSSMLNPALQHTCDFTIKPGCCTARDMLNAALQQRLLASSGSCLTICSGPCNKATSAIHMYLVYLQLLQGRCHLHSAVTYD